MFHRKVAVAGVQRQTMSTVQEERTVEKDNQNISLVGSLRKQKLYHGRGTSPLAENLHFFNFGISWSRWIDQFPHHGGSRCLWSYSVGHYSQQAA